MLVKHLGVEAHQFLSGEGIEIASDGIDRARDIFRRTMRGPLKEHVLDEMRNPILFRGFTAGAGTDPDSHGNGPHMRHGLGDDTDAVRQSGKFDVPYGTERSSSRQMCPLLPL